MLRTVTAIERDGLDVRVLVLNFEVPDEKFDLMAAVKAAALEYCQSEDGKKTFLDYNCGYFNWADFEMHVPNEICEKHGFSVLGSPVADLVVDWDEQLVDRDEVYPEEEEDLEDVEGLPEGIEKASYVSVWDGGHREETACKVSRKTGDVFGIEKFLEDNEQFMDSLVDEYVRFADGTEIAAVDGHLVMIDTLLDLEVVRDYMNTVRLEDYGLGARGIDEDDVYAVRERVNDFGGSLEEVVHGYLMEIREELDGSDFPLRHYDDAVRYLCEVLNIHDEEADLFIPIFMSENYFGIYVWHNESNEYYLVDRHNGELKMVLGDSFEFVGKNTLDCMKDEKILNVANVEWLHYLVQFSLDNVKGVVPEQELRGIAVLQAALWAEHAKYGGYHVGQSLLEKIEAAQRSAAYSQAALPHSKAVLPAQGQAPNAKGQGKEAEEPTI